MSRQRLVSISLSSELGQEHRSWRDSSGNEKRANQSAVQSSQGSCLQQCEEGVRLGPVSIFLFRGGSIRPSHKEILLIVEHILDKLLRNELINWASKLYRQDHSGYQWSARGLSGSRQKSAWHWDHHFKGELSWRRRYSFLYLGEICYRGRNVFMGYYKNAEESAKTMDTRGFLHSGDNGKLTNGTLFITGRAKELIITAGG